MTAQTSFTGKDLIALGYKPGRAFQEAIKRVNAEGLSGEAIHALMRELDPPKIVKPVLPLQANPPQIQFDLRAEMELEARNVDLVRRSMELLVRTPGIVAAAVMPDAHPSGAMGTITVGGVIGILNGVMPGAHSADTCCSMTMSELADVDPRAVLDAASATCHFGKGGRPDVWDDLPAGIEEAMAANPFLQSEKTRRMAHTHVRTIGDGNHFISVGRSEATGRVILVTHHGSRGVGAALFNAGMEVAERFRQELSPETHKDNAWIPLDTPEGRDYREGLAIVRAWTKMSHERTHDVIAATAGARVTDRRWNEHNFCFFEDDVPGGTVVSHAKGATPIHRSFLPDTDGIQIVPMNMAQPILLIRGTRNDRNLGFAPHGAGRNMSRTAIQKILAESGLTPEQIFARETQGVDVRAFSSLGHDMGELPIAYKSADTVQAQMAEFGLAEVVDRVQPYDAMLNRGSSAGALGPESHGEAGRARGRGRPPCGRGRTRGRSAGFLIRTTPRRGRMSEHRHDEAGQDTAGEPQAGVPLEAFEYEDDVTPEGMALVRARAGVTLAGRRFRRLDGSIVEFPPLEQLKAGI